MHIKKILDIEVSYVYIYSTMFFRETTSKKAKRPTLQLVENYRMGDKVRQRIIVSLGVDFNIPKKDRKTVAYAVKQKLKGQTLLFERSEIKIIAERIVKRIQTNGKWTLNKSKGISSSQKGTEEKKDEHIEEVYIDKVEHGNGRILGPLLIGHTFWNRLGFSEILKECGFNSRQINIAEISVLNRLIAQNSEHAIPSWVNTVAVEDIIDHSAEDYRKDRFYHISDQLLRNKDLIEEQLYEREIDLFKLNNVIYLYDLTNTYFEGICKSNPQAQFNKNQKEKRRDCRQIVVALVLDYHGFIRRHHIFEGKMTDVKSLEEILKILKSDFQDEQMPTIIMDRGVVCNENIELLKSYELKYIVATRSSEERDFIDDFTNADFKTLRDDKNSHIEVYLKKEGEETYLLCRSRAKQSKEVSIRNQAEKRLDDDISKLAKLIKTGKRVDPILIQRSIGRIKERHKRVCHYYCIEYTPFSFDYNIDEVIAKRVLNKLRKLKEKSEQYKISHIKLKLELEKLARKYPQDYAKISIDIKEPYFSGKPMDEKKDKLQRLDGNYLIKTNRDDLTDEQIWEMYMMLIHVESAFRNLKTDLKLRPNYHQIEKRVNGHIFITILAYHLLHSIEYFLRENNYTTSWATIKRIVSNHTYSTITLPTPKGSVIHLRKPGTPEAIHEQIYKKLRINTNILPVRKIEV